MSWPIQRLNLRMSSAMAAFLSMGSPSAEGTMPEATSTLSEMT